MRAVSCWEMSLPKKRTTKARHYFVTEIGAQKHICCLNPGERAFDFFRGAIQSDVAVGFLLPRPSGERVGERGLACHGAALWMFCGAVDGVIVAISLIAATAHPTGLEAYLMPNL